MTKYHVEFDADFDNDEAVIRAGFTGSYEPQNLVLTKISPEFEAGWYKRIEDGEFASILYLFTSDIREYVEDYDAEAFTRHYLRMKDPEPWSDEPKDPFAYRVGSRITEEEFNSLPEGSRITDRDGDEWFRRDGEWKNSSYDWTLYYGDYDPFTLIKVGNDS